MSSVPGNKNQKYYLISGNENENIQPQETKTPRLQNYSLHTLFDEGCIEINLLFFQCVLPFHIGGVKLMYILCACPPLSRSAGLS